jgi:hypothetical protein
MNYDQHMAESGQQSTLDQQRRDGTYNAAKSAWEGGGGSDTTYTDILKKLEGNTNEYIGKLTEVAQGNYDFTAKWIEANYKEALGNDDTKRADFFKSVANDLEKQIGRIAYDYQTGSYRLTQNRDLALQRLQEDNKILTQDLSTKKMLAQEQQNTSLNQRGLMDSGTRGTVQGIANRDIGQMEQDYERQFQALSRSLGRGTEDISRTYSTGLEDLTTQQRRLGENAQMTQQQQLEQAQIDLANEKKRLEAEKLGLLSQNTTTAQSLANLQKYGVS